MIWNHRVRILLSIYLLNIFSCKQQSKSVPMIFLITLRFVLQDQWGVKVKKPQWKTLSVFLPLQSLPPGSPLPLPLSFWWGRAPLPLNLPASANGTHPFPPQAYGPDFFTPGMASVGATFPRWLVKWHSTLFRGSSCKPLHQSPPGPFSKFCTLRAAPLRYNQLSPAPYRISQRAAQRLTAWPLSQPVRGRRQHVGRGGNGHGWDCTTGQGAADQTQYRPAVCSAIMCWVCPKAQSVRFWPGPTLEQVNYPWQRALSQDEALLSDEQNILALRSIQGRQRGQLQSLRNQLNLVITDDLPTHVYFQTLCMGLNSAQLTAWSFLSHVSDLNMGTLI